MSLFLTSLFRIWTSTSFLCWERNLNEVTKHFIYTFMIYLVVDCSLTKPPGKPPVFWGNKYDIVIRDMDAKVTDGCQLLVN